MKGITNLQVIGLVATVIAILVCVLALVANSSTLTIFAILFGVVSLGALMAGGPGARR